MHIRSYFLALRGRIASGLRRAILGKPRNFAREYLRGAGEIELVVHVGAHLAQEADGYRALGARRIIWIEGDPETYARLVQRLETVKPIDASVDHVAICALVSETEAQPIAFHRFNNDGASSSVYPPTECLKRRWPSLDTMGKAVELRTRTLESILDQIGLEPSSKARSLLVLDVQGHEAAVLAGMGRYVRHFELCECEISKEPIYEGGALYADIKTIFDAMGYDLVSHCEATLPWHGDVIFRRRRTQ
jgi:FkbM family methyltransferase